jgi:hypothetical protein
VQTSGSAQSASLGAQFATPLGLVITDAFGNPVPGVSVIFNAPTAGPTVIFTGGATAVTNASGQVTKTIAANNIAGNVLVTLSVPQYQALTLAYGVLIVNPLPTITFLSTNTVSKIVGPFTLTINGTGFISSSFVTMAGNSLQISSITPTQITCVLNLIALPLGTFQILVTNPLPGGGTGSGQNLTITP